MTLHSGRMGEFLKLSPPELRFRFELRKNIPVTLTLTNTGDERIAFKVKLLLMSRAHLFLVRKPQLRIYLNC